MWGRLELIWYEMYWLDPLSANPTKWSNTLKQFVGNLPTNCLIVFDHFVKLVLKGLVCILWLLASLSEIMTRYVVPVVVVLLVVLLIVLIIIIRRKRNKENDGLYSQRWDRKLFLNPTSVNPTKWSNTHKQFVGC